MDDNTSAVFSAEGAKAGAAYVAYIRAFIDAAADVEAEPIPEKEVYNGAFLAFYSHLLDLAFDKYGIPQDAPEGNACSRCWCDSCANRDNCDAFPKSDGITPPPCAECSRSGCTEPLIPTDDQPECRTYKPEQHEPES